MKNMRKILTNQEGFTLIEIIAVLVILGILAAVAIPKYQSLQQQAQISALQGAVASGASQVTMAYAQCLLAQQNPNPGTISAAGVFSGCTAASAPQAQGDFTVEYGGTLPSVTVTIISGPSWFNNLQATSAAAIPTKTIVLQ